MKERKTFCTQNKVEKSQHDAALISQKAQNLKKYAQSFFKVKYYKYRSAKNTQRKPLSQLTLKILLVVSLLHWRCPDTLTVL